MMAVYTWGLGKSGQLGHGSLDNCLMPRKVKLNANVNNVAHMACGALFSVIATSSGRIFSFGTGKYGRLGAGDECDHPIPQEINGSNKGIKSVRHT